MCTWPFLGRLFPSRGLALLGIILFTSLSEAVVINHFASSFLSGKGLPLFFVSLLLLVKRVAKLVFDVPMGVVASRFGLKSVLIFSRLCKVLSILLLLLDYRLCLFLSMVLYGLAHVSFYGKFEVYIYNYLHQGKYTGRAGLLFRRVISLCYAIQDGVGFLVVLIGSRIFVGNYVALIILSALTVLPFFGFGFLLPDVSPAYDVGHSFLGTFTLARKAIFNRNLMPKVVFLGIAIGLGFSLADILQLGLIDANEGANRVAIFSGITGCAMSIGCIVSAFLSPFVNSTRVVSWAMSALLLLFPICFTFFGLNFYTSLVIIPYLLAFPMFEVFLQLQLDKSVKIDDRAFASSVVTTLATIVAGIAGLSVSFLGSIICYRNAVSIVSLVFIIAIIWVASKIRT